MTFCTCGNDGREVDPETMESGGGGKPYGFFLGGSRFNGEPVTTVKITVGVGVNFSYPREVVCGKCGNVVNSREELWTFSRLVELILQRFEAESPGASHRTYDDFKARVEDYVWVIKNGRRRVTPKAKCFRRYALNEAARRITEEVFGLKQPQRPSIEEAIPQVVV